MAFSDAIPVTPVAESRFEAAAGRDHPKSFAPRQTRQSVNVSRETVAKVAKEKLTQAMVSKVAYNRFGELNEKPDVGQNLSTRA